LCVGGFQLLHGLVLAAEQALAIGATLRARCGLLGVLGVLRRLLTWGRLAVDAVKADGHFGLARLRHYLSSGL
jgi:hypothetical protein